jgi:protein O-mannosyl-transferase
MLHPPAQGQAVQRRPVVKVSLAVNYALSGLHVWSYHATNLALHILAALALLGVVGRTLQSPRLQARFGGGALGIATVIALIWALHPLQTEAVTYIIQRTEVLAGLFYLLTLYAAIRTAQSTAPDGMPEPLRPAGDSVSLLPPADPEAIFAFASALPSRSCLTRSGWQARA